MKAIGYYIAIGLLLVLLIVLAIAIAHLQWWGALMLVTFAAYMMGQTRLIWIGVATAHRHPDSSTDAQDSGILVHNVERCGDQPSLATGEVAYRAEVTVTPHRQGDAPVEWNPADVAVSRAIEELNTEWASVRSWRRRSGAGALATLQWAVQQVEVYDGAQYVPLARGLLCGEQRLRVRFLAAERARRVHVHACGGMSAAVDLPAA